MTQFSTDISLIIETRNYQARTNLKHFNKKELYSPCMCNKMRMRVGSAI